MYKKSRGSSVSWYSPDRLYTMRWELCYFLFFIGFFVVFWTNAVTFNENGDLLVGQANLWADWAAHFTMGSAMAYRDLLPESSPLMLDAAFSYPFGTNFISAVLIRMGVPFHLAFVIPSFIFSLFFVAVVYVFFRLFLRNRNVAILAAALFLFNGGVGIYYFLADIVGSPNPLMTLLNPTREYTNYDEHHIKWISVINSMLIPQRAFALGFSVCLLALSLLFYSFQLLQERTQAPSWKLNGVAGILLGILPLLHAHSFLAAFVILVFWLAADLVVTNKEHLKQRIFYWLGLVVVTSAIALPIIFTYFIDSVGGHFFKWFPGWYAKEFGINWFVMWFKNWTFVPFLGFVGFGLLIARQKSRLVKWHAALIVAPGTLLFLVPNLVLTQPWVWDNTKLFIWSSVFLSPMAAFVLCHLFTKDGPAYHGLVRTGQWFSHTVSRHSVYELKPLPVANEGDPERVELIRYLTRITKQRISYWSVLIRKVLFVFLIMFMCGAGFVDAYYSARTDLHTFTMYNKNELDLAEWVKENTDTDSIWLTSTKHNHWLFNLTGRQAVLTYTAWLWSHGHNYHQHEQDAKQIFSTANQDLVEKYGINYIIYDHAAQKDLGASKIALDKSFQLIKQSGQYTIYKTRLE